MALHKFVYCYNYYKYVTKPPLKIQPRLERVTTWKQRKRTTPQKSIQPLTLHDAAEKEDKKTGDSGAYVLIVKYKQATVTI